MRNRRHRQYHAPDDWSEGDGYVSFVICVPNSRKWRAIVRGQLWELTWWYTWHHSTSPNIEVRKIAEKIYNSIMTCNLDEVLKEISQTNQQTALLLYSAITKTSVNLDVENNPVWSSSSRQFGDASGVFSSDSPFYQQFLTAPKMNLTEALYYTFNEKFSFNPFPDFTKTFHEMVLERLTAVSTATTSLSTALVNALKSLLRLEGTDFLEIAESPNIVTAMMMSFTDYTPKFFGVGTNLTDFILNFLKIDNSPVSHFSHKPTASTDDQSIAKILHDKTLTANIDLTATNQEIAKIATNIQASNPNVNIARITAELGKLVAAVNKLETGGSKLTKADWIEIVGKIEANAVAVAKCCGGKGGGGGTQAGNEETGNVGSGSVTGKGDLKLTVICASATKVKASWVGLTGAEKYKLGVLDANDSRSEQEFAKNTQRITIDTAWRPLPATFTVSALDASGKVISTDSVTLQGCEKSSATQPTTTKTYLPVIKKQLEKHDPCQATGVGYFIEVLETLVTVVDVIEDSFMADLIGGKAVTTVLTWVARVLPAAGGTLLLAGIVEPTPAGEIIGAPTFLGTIVISIIIQVLIDFGIEALRFAVEYVKHDYDYWKALECSNEPTFDFGVSIGRTPQRAYDYAKRLGKSDKIANGAKELIKKLTLTDMRKMIKRIKDVVN